MLNQSLKVRYTPIKSKEEFWLNSAKVRDFSKFTILTGNSTGSTKSSTNNCIWLNIVKELWKGESENKQVTKFHTTDIPIAIYKTVKTLFSVGDGSKILWFKRHLLRSEEFF